MVRTIDCSQELNCVPVEVWHEMCDIGGGQLVWCKCTRYECADGGTCEQCEEATAPIG
jgi:hypothetical protein